MSPAPSVEVTVYPDDCDAHGELNQTGFVRLLERARWEVIARGPGIEIFQSDDAWPVVRRSTLEFHTGVFPLDRLQVNITLTHLGETSFTLHQTVRREGDRTLVAEAETVLVCVNQAGNPTGVPEAVSRYFGTRPSMRAGTTNHAVVRGVTMAFDMVGDGPAVVFVHGFPLDRTMWRHQVSALGGWRRVAPDLRGMGLSEAPTAATFSMTEYVDDLVGLMDTLRVERWVLCGLSMGGYVAFELARRHPERLRGLILANTKAEADGKEAKAARDEVIAAVRREGPAVLVDRMLPKLLAPGSVVAMPRVVEMVRTMIANNPVDGLVGALIAMRDRPDQKSLLGEIRAPTLVLAGKGDQLIPVATAEAMAAAIPGARLAMIEEAGHLAPLEQPIATSRAVSEFLESLNE